MKRFRKLTDWYFSRAALPYWSVLVVDYILVFFAGLLTFLIHHGPSETSRAFIALIGSLFVTLLCYTVGFRVFHTYGGVIRYSSFADLMRASSAVILGVILAFVFSALIEPSPWLLKLESADIIVTGAFAIAFMWTLRMWVKTIYEVSIHRPERAPSFIFGVREGGIALAKNIDSSSHMPYAVRGFVSDQPDMTYRWLRGHMVYPFDKNLLRVMRSKGVNTLIVSPLMMDTLRTHDSIVDDLVTHGINLLVIPEAKKWDGKSDLSAADLHPVDVEDLLPRDRIEVDMQAASDLLKGRTVLITGAAGSIGSEMVRQVASYAPARLVLIDQAETPMHDVRLSMARNWPGIECETIVADITDSRMMQRIFERCRPQYVFHAAAYKHVPMMETNPYEAVVNNVYGTKVIADLAVRYGTDKFVMVSTDKAVNPTNVMGCSKRICEIYVQSLDKALKEGSVEGRTQFVTTRFGNVLGSNGSVIPIFQEQIRKGGPVTVTHPDIIRFFMLIPEACKLVIEAGTMGKGGEIYIFDMGQPVKIADLARRMITLSGARDIQIKYTGLRDGEKLYEEVLNDKEVTMPTFHPKIKIAKVREYAYADVDDEIRSMVDAAPDEDDMQIVARMKAMVPEFVSMHSRFETLDAKGASAHRQKSHTPTDA